MVITIKEDLREELVGIQRRIVKGIFSQSALDVASKLITMLNNSLSLNIQVQTVTKVC